MATRPFLARRNGQGLILDFNIVTIAARLIVAADISAFVDIPTRRGS
jgi:hypothetical protein